MTSIKMTQTIKFNIQISEDFYYAIKQCGCFGFITKDVYDGNSYRVKATKNLTVSNEWLDYSDSSLKKVIIKILNNDGEVFKFNTDRELFKFLADNI